MKTFKCTCGEEIQISMYGDPEYISNLLEENARLTELCNALAAMYSERDEEV